MSRTHESGSSVPVMTLAPIMLVVFVAYLIIGIPLPVLPMHVHRDLGLSTVVVGVIAGSQFAASLLSRMWAGHLSDTRGAKVTVVTGLLFGSAAGALYLASMLFSGAPMRAAAVLLLGRLALGIAESALITGSLSWGLVLADGRSSGRVMAWIGTGLYAALAAGAPAGTLLFDAYGFGAVALVTTTLPLVALGVVLPLARPSATSTASRPSFAAIARAVAVPGGALALCGFGFAAVTTFMALLFADRGWGPIWAAYTGFSLAFIVGRSLLGHLPDVHGGARVALVCVAIETTGLVLVGLSSGMTLVMCGVILTGLGYALVYPGLGVEAIRLAPPESRGLAMGAYTAFLDVSLGLGSPVLGWVASVSSFSAVFLVSAGFVLVATPLILRLLGRRT